MSREPHCSLQLLALGSSSSILGCDPHAVGMLHVDPGVFAEAILLRRKYAIMKDAARARLGDARWVSSEHTLNLTQPEKRRRLAVLLEQRRHRRRLGHDLLDAAGRPPPRHAEEEERREEVEAEAEVDAPKMPALL